MSRRPLISDLQMAMIMVVVALPCGFALGVGARLLWEGLYARLA